MTSRRGMTLMELVVGLTVAGLALAMGAAALTGATDQRARAEAAVSATARIAAERRQLAAWVAGAKLTPDGDGPPFRGLDGTDGDLPDDELTFLTGARVSGERGPTVIRLLVDRDSATPEQGLTAELRQLGPGRRVARIEIEPAAASLDLRYSTRMLGRTEWLPSWISSTVLPSAVEISLGARPGDTLPGLLRLPVLIPLGNVR
ncbi:MAG TPA: prepilin-type N-terminal cleavage/methylation domain-containing protein [Gemmatimonadales bacterium]